MAIFIMLLKNSLKFDLLIVRKIKEKRTNVGLMHIASDIKKIAYLFLLELIQIIDDSRKRNVSSDNI